MRAMSDSIRAVIFDLDGTLLDRGRTFTHHLEEQARRHADLLAPHVVDAYVQQMLVLDQNGYTARDEFYRLAEQQLSLPAGAATRLFDDFRTHYPERSFPFPGAIETLEQLRRSGFALGLITNGSVTIQSRKIDQLGIAPLVDTILISEAEGVRKPDPRIFVAALQRLGVAPEAAVYIGDNPEVDIVGAQRSGLRAIWKRDGFWPDEAKADAIIDELNEIPGTLSEWGVSC